MCGTRTCRALCRAWSLALKKSHRDIHTHKHIHTHTHTHTHTHKHTHTYKTVQDGEEALNLKWGGSGGLKGLLWWLRW